MHVLVPAGEVSVALLRRAGLEGTRCGPALALHGGDEVHDLPAVEGVGHRVPAGPDPRRADHLLQVRRQPVPGDEPAPGHHPGEGGAVGTPQLRAYDGAPAVRSDHHVPGGPGAVVEQQGRRVRVLLHTDGAGTEPDGVRVERAHTGLDRGQQVRTVDGEVRVAVLVDGEVAQVEERPRLAAVPQPELLALRRAGRRAQRVEDAEVVEGTASVRADLDARSDLRERRCLLVHLDLDPPLQQGERGRHAADPAACDDDLHGSSSQSFSVRSSPSAPKTGSSLARTR